MSLTASEMALYFGSPGFSASMRCRAFGSCHGSNWPGSWTTASKVLPLFPARLTMTEAMARNSSFEAFGGASP
jgi:hypothetical protein